MILLPHSITLLYIFNKLFSFNVNFLIYTTELYKAPRRAAAMYDDEEKDVKNQQILEKTRKKIEQSKLLNELRKFQKKKIQTRFRKAKCRL